MIMSVSLFALDPKCSGKIKLANINVIITVLNAKLEILYVAIHLQVVNLIIIHYTKIHGIILNIWIVLMSKVIIVILLLMMTPFVISLNLIINLLLVYYPHILTHKNKLYYAEKNFK